MAEPEVLARFDEAGAVGVVTLNRASKLNALNINMIRLLHKAIDEVDRRKGKLGCMIMDSVGKAFCAGGDVAEVRAEALAGGSLPADFFFSKSMQLCSVLLHCWIAPAAVRSASGTGSPWVVVLD
mmetsp:Transcript_80583/g.153139  ORF Transcript_80583/g.153139 Transcript_80583/m.153139 type:complete len:125 (+) Transcript_80583:73-447(+)